MSYRSGPISEPRGPRLSSEAAPGAISNLTTPTATSTSATATFSTPTGTITGYQYRIDGGTATSLGGGSGTAITGLTTGIPVSVEVRAMNGGTPGPWSNVATADPGLDVRIIFDTSAENLDGNSNGSWEVNPTNVFITGGPNISTGVGFSSSGERTKAISVVTNFWSDMRRLIDSIGRVNCLYGAGRFQSQFDGDWVANNSGSGNSATWSGQDTSLPNYSDYQAKISALTNATQKACWPGGGTVADPGAYPAGANWGISQNLDAIWTNNTSNTGKWFMTNNPGFSFSYSTDPSVNDNGGLMYNFTVWHEGIQPFGIAISNAGFIFRSIYMMLTYSSSGTHWNQSSNNNPYTSINNGVTSLGAIQQPADSLDIGSYRASVTGALSFVAPTFGGTGLPASPLQMPNSGRIIPIQINDAKTLCAGFPPTPALKTLAGL